MLNKERNTLIKMHELIHNTIESPKSEASIPCILIGISKDFLISIMTIERYLNLFSHYLQTSFEYLQ